VIPCGLILASVWLQQAYSGEDIAAPGDAAAETKDARTEGMRERAEAIVVNTLETDDEKALNLMPGPWFRYNDGPRRIVDATLWGWGTTGRPLAVQKIELYSRRNGSLHWFYCMASLSEGLIHGLWRDGTRWSAKKSGVEMRVLPEEPKPSASAIGRLVQMKNIARRFSSRMADPPTEEQMRLLARPIYRYSDPNAGLVDGAIFGFASNGTNPDLLLLIELHGQEPSESSWRYGLARMTTAELSVRFDQKEVWSAPFVRGPGQGGVARFDTWLFFWESLGATRR
jgi:hypothetical protein